MSDLTPFIFNETGVSIRVATANGNPWILASDVASALGYAQTANALKICKGASILDDVNRNNGLHPSSKWITEPDLYRLIINSTMPAAEKFEAWVFEEVLPTIRKTGSYSTTRRKYPSLTKVSKDLTAAIAIAQSFGFTGNQALLSANRAIERAHGVDCMDLLGAKHLLADSQQALLTSTEVGQRLGISRNQINPILEQAGLLKGYRDHKNRQQWELTEAGMAYGIYQDTGKANSKGTPVRQIKWDASLICQLQKSITTPLVQTPKTH